MSKIDISSQSSHACGGTVIRLVRFIPASSTPSTLLLDSRSHIARTSSLKHDRRGSLGLIDAARVRLTKDFRAFVRSNSRLHHHQTSFEAQAEETEDPRFVYPDYAQNLRSQPADLDIVPMELVMEDRHGRGLGTKIANFLSRSRSRSRSKKRRSRSLDAVSRMPMPLEGGALTIHARHSSLDADGQNRTVTSPSHSRPSTRSQSRPLSSNTMGTNTTIKPLPQKPSKPLPRPSRNAHPIDVHTEVVILEQATAKPARKSRKMNLFGLSLPSPRMGTFGNSSKSKSQPATPGSQPSGKFSEHGFWSGQFRSNSGSTSHKSQDDSDHIVTKDDVLWDNSRTALSPTPPQHRPSPVRALTAPSHPQGEYERVEDEIDAQMNALGGRCSPLCGLTSPRMTTAAVVKGKESERVRGARERERSQEKERARERIVWTEKVKEKERERITHPRRVGSPVPRERDRASRNTPGAVPMEKVASGSGTSRSSRRRDGTTTTSVGVAPLPVRARGTKHGSFDFERPVSDGATGINVKVPTRVTGSAARDDAHPLQRSASARGISRRGKTPDGYSEYKTHQPVPAPPPLQSKGKAKPVLDVNTQNLFLTRRVTGSSTATSTHPHPLVSSHLRVPDAKAHNGSETDPSSPISSTHSGNSSGLNSSWGRSAGKRMVRPSHPPFKFEPAVPPIPGSPASDERKRSASGNDATTPGPPVPPPKSKHARMTGKGRSLDLGLGLSWAPTKIREDIVMRTGASGSATADAGVRARARWRDAIADEEGRLGASGTASDVAEAFRKVLGDAAYGTFKNYVHRYDAHAIPLDGPFGLLLHVQRLLDSAPGLDPRRKQALLDRFVHVVQTNR